MKKIFILFLLLTIKTVFANGIYLREPLTFNNYLNGFIANPALLGADQDFGFYLRMDYDEDKEQLFAFRAPKFFAFYRDFKQNITNLSFAYSFISNISAGISYIDRSNKNSYFNLGLLYRPTRYLSIGYKIDDFFHKRPDMNYGIAVRPWGNKFTCYFQQELFLPSNSNLYKNRRYYGGMQVSPINGLTLDFSYDNSKTFTSSFTISLAHFFAGGLASGTKDNIVAVNRQFIGYSFYQNKPIIKTKNKVVELEIKGDYTENGLSKNSFEKDRFYQLIKELKLIKKQTNVSKMFLKIYPFNASFAQLQEIRNQIIDFRKTGEIICYSEDLDLKTYYIASVSNQIITPSASEITLNDFVPQEHFFQMILQNQGIEINAFKLGEYEGSTEKITQQKFSDPVKENRVTMYNKLTEFIINEIAESRATSPTKIKETIKKTPLSSYDALQLNLIDAIGFEDEARYYLIDFGTIRKNKFKSFPPSIDKKTTWKPRENIAVVYLQGSLIKGNSFQMIVPHPVFGSNFLGVNDFQKVLNSCVQDDNIKAIVIRMDSGGGQAGAVEKIWNLIFEANRIKPVVISIAGNGTSGGYYVATAASSIFAQETSLVGGIGFSAYHWNWDETLASKGIQTFIPKRDFYNYSGFNCTPISIEQKKNFDKISKQFYQQFIAKVSISRQKSIKDIDFIARGKIYSGLTAKRYGLIDEIGGLENSISKAKKLAGIPENSPVSFIKYSYWKQKYYSFKTSSYKEVLSKQFYYHSGINNGL